MKVTIDFESEIDKAVQHHLDFGDPSVRDYVRAAVKFFNDMLKAEDTGNLVGFGNKSTFKSYNTEVSPGSYLRNI